MKKFIRYQIIKRISFKDEFLNIEDCEALDINIETRGSVQETECEYAETLNVMKTATTFDLTFILFKISKTSFIKPVLPRLSGKAGHGQDMDTNSNISFCHADSFW